MYDSNQPLVPLEKDLNFVKNYVELMRIRLPQHVEVEIDIAPATDAVMIAPLLFISLVENAFKHGVSSSKPSFIHIRICREGNRVICAILNSDFHKDAARDMSGSGIGIANLQRRLSLLYPGGHVFEYGAEGENYRSCLSITVNEPDV
jgi:sensor histidine kinase YesM